jgi:hypothetical protein
LLCPIVRGLKIIVVRFLFRMLSCVDSPLTLPRCIYTPSAVYRRKNRQQPMWVDYKLAYKIHQGLVLRPFILRLFALKSLANLQVEIFLKHYENHIIKNILDNNKINFYNTYVDDIIIFDSTNTNVDEISDYMNNLHKHLQFKSTEEDNNTISFLDLLIDRNHNGLSINIYRKSTTDTTIHFN